MERDIDRGQDRNKEGGGEIERYITSGRKGARQINREGRKTECEQTREGESEKDRKRGKQRERERERRG